MIDYKSYIAETGEISSREISLTEKLYELKKLLERLSRELTADESIQFSTLFSRLVFLAQKHQIPKQLEWRLQSLRVRSKTTRKKEQTPLTQPEYRQHERTLLNKPG